MSRQTEPRGPWLRAAVSLLACIGVIGLSPSAAVDACCTLTVELIGPATACAGAPVNVQAITSGNPDNHEITYAWTQDSVAATTFTMPASGYTEICVTVTDTVNGCHASACITVGVQGCPGVTVCPIPMPSPSFECNAATEATGTLSDSPCQFGFTTPGHIVITWDVCYDCSAGEWRAYVVRVEATPITVFDWHGRTDLAGQTNCAAAAEAKAWYDDAVANSQNYDPVANHRMCQQDAEGNVISQYVPKDCVIAHERFMQGQACAAAYVNLSGLTQALESCTATGCEEAVAQAAMTAAVDLSKVDWGNDLDDYIDDQENEIEKAAWGADISCMKGVWAALCGPCPPCPPE